MNGSVMQRGKKWSVLIDLGPGPDGKRQRKWHSGFPTKKEAEKARIGLLHDLEHGTYSQPTKTTVAEFLTQWLDSYAASSVAPLTLQRYRGIILGRVMRDLGDVPLQKLRPDHILAARAKWAAETTRFGKPLSARSILHHHRVLREALGHAVKWGLLVVNPAARVDAPKVEQAQMQVLNVEQSQRLLAAALVNINADEDGAVYNAVVATTLLTGLRLGEVLGLAWDDVDLEQGQMSVVRSLQQIRGQGLVLRPPKTARSVRTLALGVQVVEILKLVQHRQKLARMKAGTAYMNIGLVFADALGGPISPNTTRRHYYALLADTSLPRVRFHDLRHGHASLMLSAGVNAKVVSERLGHSTVGFTLQTYAHTLPGMQQQAAATLDALLTAPTVAAAV